LYSLVGKRKKKRKREYLKGCNNCPNLAGGVSKGPTGSQQFGYKKFRAREEELKAQGEEEMRDPLRIGNCDFIPWGGGGRGRVHLNS